MAISYPLSTPDPRTARVAFTHQHAQGKTTNPFSYQTDVFWWGGERRMMEVTVARGRADVMAEWTSFLLGLRGQEGTFLMGDPSYQKRGTATALTFAGAAGDRDVTLDVTGALLKGDFFQVGVGLGSRLYEVLEDATGSGVVTIWPAVRVTKASEAAEVANPQGLWRLTESSARWAVDSARIYEQIQFTCEEVI